MEHPAETTHAALADRGDASAPRVAAWLALRLGTIAVLWAYSVVAVLSLAARPRPVVADGAHAGLTFAVCAVSGAAGAVAWNRFRHDGTSQSLLLTVSFVGLASFYAPHVLLGVLGDDATNRLIGTVARLLFPLGLLAAAARVSLPNSIRTHAGPLLCALIVVPFVLDAVIEVGWVSSIVPVQSAALRLLLQQLSLGAMVVATVWVAVLWWRSRQPFLLVLAGAIGVLTSSSVLLLSTHTWTPRWWASHLGDLGCSMLLATGLMGEHRRRGSLLGAFDLNAVSRLAAIVEGSDEAIYSYANTGTIDSWNRAAEHEYGYTADEAVGRPLQVLAPDELLDDQRMLLERALRGETIYHAETEQRRKGGALIDMELSVAPIRSPSGEVVGASVIAHNIAERKRAEMLARQARAELERADELKSQFLAMASHELRTPLTSIAGFTTTLLEMDEQLTSEQRTEFLRIIQQQADRLNRLIGELLTLSRVEAGRLQTKPSTVDVAASIARTVTDLGATVEVDCEDGLAMLADADHVQQMLVNYVSNATKYGKPPIVVSARRDGEFVAVRVCDHGPGVPVEYEDRLFERFAQVPHSTGADVPSTGLGLSIVRGLARANGGDAWFEPNHPEGACFHLRLPAVGLA